MSKYLIGILTLITFCFLVACSPEKSPYEGAWLLDIEKSTLNADNAIEKQMERKMFQDSTISVEGNKLILSMPGMEEMMRGVIELKGKTPSENQEKKLRKVGESAFKISDVSSNVSEIAGEYDRRSTITYSVSNGEEYLLMDTFDGSGSVLTFVRSDFQ